MSKRPVYFELKAFEERKRTRLQLDVNPPSFDDGKSILDNTEFDAKRIRTMLLHVANELIPRIVASHYMRTYKDSPQAEKMIPKEIQKLSKAYADFKEASGKKQKANPNDDPEAAAQFRKLIASVASFIDNSEDCEMPKTTRFIFENVDATLEQDMRSTVNGDIPPPPRPRDKS
jgi:hypothetical protein